MKKTTETQVEQKKLNRQINIIKGQLDGIQKMINSGQDCFNILTQIKSVKSSMNSVGKAIISNRFKECMTNKTYKMDAGEVDTLLNAISK